MPIPIEYSSIRRMSTITVPKQDINFEAYDFQLCQPQTDIKGALESRELEASFCRDFACCGLILEDLHDLLQHYEECHVRLEDEESSFYDDSETTSWSSIASSSAPGSPTIMSVEENDQIAALKKKAAAYLSDLYNSTAPVSEESSNEDQEEVSAPTMSPTTTKKPSGKKRTYSQLNNVPNALDILTQTAVKKIALASGGDIPTPLLTDEEFLAQAGALLASANVNLNSDKPYKCPVGGCDKAYKNPNGLKYHNQHGHCNMTADESESLSKPYQCTIGGCGKRYKNLNGLKYHIEHSHMAVLNHTLSSFFSTLTANDELSLPSSQSSSSSF
ncbi:MAG: hypothetical protein EXX96DRAFT_559180 [Benjaminiella poitrasii]|nr:MAG: hypothetical protein EXX96DRAFT_559180 [Benjaminiella poitrasii]